MESESCIWCGTAVGHDSGFLVHALADGRCAVFCRLEHVVPWVMRGAQWGPDAGAEPPPAAERPRTCARCDCQLDHDAILLVHRRGVHAVVDAFCTLEHLRAWAGAGGRWASR